MQRINSKRGMLTSASLAKDLTKTPTRSGHNITYSRELTHSRKLPLTQNVLISNNAKLSYGTAGKGVVAIFGANKKIAGRARFFEEVFESGERVIFLSKVFTAPAYRRQGVMVQALSEIKAMGLKKKADFIYLNVESKNKTAIEAYKKFGFVRKMTEGEVENPVMITMVLKLKKPK